jgi:hypothetical protein
MWANTYSNGNVIKKEILRCISSNRGIKEINILSFILHKLAENNLILCHPILFILSQLSKLTLQRKFHKLLFLCYAALKSDVKHKMKHSQRVQCW